MSMVPRSNQHVYLKKLFFLVCTHLLCGSFWCVCSFYFYFVFIRVLSHTQNFFKHSFRVCLRCLLFTFRSRLNLLDSESLTFNFCFFLSWKWKFVIPGRNTCVIFLFIKYFSCLQNAIVCEVTYNLINLYENWFAYRLLCDVAVMITTFLPSGGFSVYKFYFLKTSVDLKRWVNIKW